MIVDLLVATDIRTAIGRRESVMRHFLTLPLAPATLPPGMMQATVERLLVAPACRPRTFAPRLASTRVGTIPLPMIAVPAHSQLLVTPCAIQQSVAGNDDRNPSSPQKAGQVLSIASLSVRDKRYRRSAQTSPKARGGYLGPSPFSEPGPTSAPAPRRTPRRSLAPRPADAASGSREKQSNQIYEGDGSKLRLNPGERFRLHRTPFARFSRFLPACA